jgi:hypothetical protein
MIDRQEARSDVARIDPAADRWLHTANGAEQNAVPEQSAGHHGKKTTIPENLPIGRRPSDTSGTDLGETPDAVYF